MTDLPEPLTPVESDVRGLEYMPLEVVRFLESELVAETAESPAVFRASVILWCKAWRETPAGSLPNKDSSLASWCGLSLGAWLEIREQVLSRFILCADGRLYHPVVAERVNTAWAGCEKQRAKANARWNKAREAEKTDAPAMPRHSTGIAKASVRHMQEEGEVEVEVEITPLTPLSGGASAADAASASEEENPFAKRARPAKPAAPPKPRKRETKAADALPPAFAEAWQAWPQRGRSSKAKAAALWKARGEEPETLLAAVTRYLASADARKEAGAYVPAFERWLRDKLDSWIELGVQTESAKAQAKREPEIPAAWSAEPWRSRAEKLRAADVAAWRDIWAHCEPLDEFEGVNLRVSLNSHMSLVGFGSARLERAQAALGCEITIFPPIQNGPSR